jgi:processive 1,2-diacylglycerol beta-glucosyltransferase
MPPAPRVLVTTAAIGAGHDLPAELLAAAVRERGGEARVVDLLAETGRIVHGLVMSSASGPGFDASYWLTQRGPGDALLRWITWRVGRRPVLRLVGEFAPDVVVSTYPGFNPTLGRLHREGLVRAPIVSAITDLAALRFWAEPDVTLHLITHAESAAEVRARAGPATSIVQVSGFSDPAFLAPTDSAAARAALGLAAAGPVCVVSGGGWGVGDLEGAVRAALEVSGMTVVCLCGTNDDLRARLAGAFAAAPGVQVWGFTDRMSDLLAAADVLVHSTAGLTVLEAQIRGTRVISYGWGAGHIRANNRAYERLGLAAVARSPGELRRALGEALAAPRAPDDALRLLPAAADVVLGLVGR